MSVLVAALARTKNNVVGSLQRGDSKMSAGEKKWEGERKLSPQAEAGVGQAERVVGPPQQPAGPSHGETAEQQGDEPGRRRFRRQLSAMSGHDSEDEEEQHEEDCESAVVEGLGPIVALKEQFERDKEDESLRRWKEQLLGGSTALLESQVVEPAVEFLTLGMTSPGRPTITVPLPLSSSSGVTFTLKEGSVYNLHFTFTVHHNIVSGLKFVHTVWKGNVQVDHTKTMLGTFSPRREPYFQIMEEETTPSGLLARGAYTAETKFVDDDDRRYLEICYSFQIQKDW